MLAGKTNIDIVNRCINSFNKQTYQNKELIIINNSSSQLSNSNLIINDLDTIVIDTPVQLSAGMARNYGIQAANGNLIAQFDPEFIWHKNRLSKQLSAILKTESHISVLSKVSSYSFANSQISTYTNSKKAILNTMMFIRPAVDYPDINKSEELGILERMTNAGMKIVSIDDESLACKLYAHDYPRSKVAFSNPRCKCANLIRDWLKT
jgi:glycosyltransferase involved in cell wall biosynthesis